MLNRNATGVFEKYTIQAVNNTLVISSWNFDETPWFIPKTI